MKILPSIYKLNSSERMRLLDFLNAIEREALQWEVGRACSADPVGLADCSSFSVRVIRATWKRNARQLHVFLTLRINGPSGPRMVNWHKALPAR